ncbi:MAG: hypothetical protein LIP01_00740 [Tannerellaceae bacterium]|nr:hypothetical protein [Tannerellaceae bacterium]
MKKTLYYLYIFFFANICLLTVNAQEVSGKVALSDKALQLLAGKQILYIEREQYVIDHHNTETLFQFGEINENSFTPGSAIRLLDIDSKTIKTLLEVKDGVVRDPEFSFDGKNIIFSMRKNKEDDCHIYEMDADGSNIRQLTFARGVSDIDPLYLPDGGIVFSSTRQPKYCMCNRHIMCNLYRMNNDDSQITQIGVSTLFEGHAALLNDGRILYDRWEYVDRNFGDAQALWTVNPDGTKHAIYYGNNTPSPGGIIDGRAIPGSDLIVCIFTSCHDRPWGAMAILDRKLGVDGVEPVVQIWPANTRELVGNGNLDTFKWIDNFYEDSFPIDENNFLVSRTIWFTQEPLKEKMGIYLVGRDGTEELLLEGNQSLFDPQIAGPRFKPNSLPFARNFEDKNGQFYVQNVYEGTHMAGVEKGSVKYLRVVESPEKRTWTARGWFGEGEQAPGVNWHSFEVKRILGEVVVEEDGSASFEAPTGKHVYFQLLDKDKKMIQSMRSGVSLMPGEVNGCIGCHEDRLSAPIAGPSRATALRKAPQQLQTWQNREPFNFSFMQEVQPILDKHCVSCHDFDRNDREKLVLARDKNPSFNAAYIDLYMKKVVSLVGGGPAAIQPAYTWGSHTSKLTQIIDTNHNGVKLTDKEKETFYTWMDLNGVYYPVYESAFDTTLAGRSPLYDMEIGRLMELTGINFWEQNYFGRELRAQISFDRPEMSPCLDAIYQDEAKYNEALAIIRTGQTRLEATPRGDIESELVPCERNMKQLTKYIERLSEQNQNSCIINTLEKRFDKK